MKTKKTDARMDQNARGAGIAAATPKADMVMVPIDAIDVVDNVRTQMDETALFELAESMKSVGLLEPVIVHKAGKRFAMIAGHRRLAAAKQNGEAFIEAKVFGALDEATVARMQLAENLQREDLNHIDIAKKLGAARDAGMSVSQIAGEINCSDDFVRRHLDLLRLDGRVSELVASGRLPVKHAEMIARIGENKKQIELAERVCGAASWYGAKDRNAALAGDTVITLDDLRKEVAQAMASLASGGWPMDVEFADRRACVGCENNTATYADQPKLFEGIAPKGSAKKGYCTNGDCFEVKLKAWEKGEAKRKAAEAKELARQIANARKSGLTICDGCGRTGGDIVGAEVAVAFGAIKTAGTFDLCPACRKKNEKLAKRPGRFDSYDQQRVQVEKRKKNFPETPEEKQAVAMFKYAQELAIAISERIENAESLDALPGVREIIMRELAVGSLGWLTRNLLAAELPQTLELLSGAEWPRAMIARVFAALAAQAIDESKPCVDWAGTAKNVPVPSGFLETANELLTIARKWGVEKIPEQPAPAQGDDGDDVADEKPKRKKSRTAPVMA